MDVTISENVSLKPFSTFRTGGPARFFAAVKTVDELKKAVNFAHENNLAIFVLGGGSNILISDAGFAGLVIKIEIMGIEITDDENKENKTVIAGAGENWDEFVAHVVDKNLYGIENLSLIPGSVGAAPVQNIGAYGTEVMDIISYVEAFNIETGEIEKKENKECGFTFIDSMFKKPEGKKYIILKVAFNLKESGHLNTSYKDVAKYIAEYKLSEADLSLKKLREIVIDIRTKKLPNIKEYGTAGSFFKNPVIPKAKSEELVGKYPELPVFPMKNTTDAKVSAAWILDNICGFKGYREGDVGIYKNQALVIVNFGNATADEVKSLAEKMSECVKEKTGIILEKEVQYI